MNELGMEIEMITSRTKVEILEDVINRKNEELRMLLDELMVLNELASYLTSIDEEDIENEPDESEDIDVGSVYDNDITPAKWDAYLKTTSSSANKKWSKAEESKLLFMYQNGLSLFEMSKRLKRTRKACADRLVILGCDIKGMMKDMKADSKLIKSLLKESVI